MVTDMNVKIFKAKKCADCKHYAEKRNLCLRLKTTIMSDQAQNYTNCKHWEKP